MTKNEGKERRQAPRRPILETFSVFCVVPKKGFNRLQIHDMSELGMRFDLDSEGEPQDTFPVKKGESLEVHFYLNQSLYLPLAMEVNRLEAGESIRRIGASFQDTQGKAYKAFRSFLTMLDAISEVAEITSS